MSRDLRARTTIIVAHEGRSVYFKALPSEKALPTFSPRVM